MEKSIFNTVKNFKV